MSAAPRLEAQGLSKRFGSTAAVVDVDLAVRDGEIRAVVGENGAGKSTLMNLLAGVLQPDAGSMRLDGEPYRPSSPLAARRRGVALIHQELALADHLSVVENLFLGIETTRFALLQRGAMRERARRVLEELGHSEIPLSRPAGRLSLAQRQIVEIARALLLESRLLILDEPTSSLSRPDKETLFRLIRRLAQRGLAILYISHFLEEVEEIAATYSVLRDGRLVGDGQVAERSRGELVRLMVGRDIGAMFPRSERTPGEVLLEVSDLAGERLPVEAGFTLRRGEVLGIAGLVGAGRSELLRSIFGLEPVVRGRIRIGTLVDSVRTRPAVRLRQGVGLASEDRQGEGLAPALDVATNLTLSRLPGPGRLGRWGLVSQRQMRAAARRWIETLDIQCRDPDQRVVELSGGNQQKVALGRLLHHDLDVLLLDEPTRGVDVQSRIAIYRLIDDLTARGKGIVLVSSYLPELLGIADRIAVMSRGRLGAARPVEELDDETILMACTLDPGAVDGSRAGGSSVETSGA